MTAIGVATRFVEQLTGLARPNTLQLSKAARNSRSITRRFKPDGIIPNHPRWPLILYRRAIRFEAGLDPAAVCESLFESNGWGDSWRNGIYHYAHYHSRIHEVLAVARGSGRVRFGGNSGSTFKLEVGDVAILPAGTGHQALSNSEDFLVVGAYPPHGTYDECTSIDELKKAKASIPKVSRPANDPVFGKAGLMIDAWKRLRK